MNTPTPQNTSILELRKATMSWPRPGGGRITAVHSLDLAVQAADLGVIRGPSGSGKTTLLLLAGGLLQPHTGSRIGTPRVGFIFQTLELLPYLDVRQNIRLGLSKAGDEDDVEQLLEELGLTERADHRPHQLSTGECQRTATARALASRPALLLADEPTGNLDPENALIVLRALDGLVQRGGAVLVATHGSIEGLNPTRQFTMDSGTLSESGNTP
jgi:putative ABC transport system ATP-binding protein